MNSKYQKCCHVTNVFGYSLKQGIVIVAVSSIIISMTALVASLIFLLPRWSEKTSSYNTEPVNAIYFISALFGTSISLYEIIISITMLWFLRWKKMVFLLSLWFVSNVSLLVLCFFLSVARTAICAYAKQYTQAFFNAILGIIYEVVFIYFCIAVNSYELSLDPETIFY